MKYVVCSLVVYYVVLMFYRKRNNKCREASGKVWQYRPIKYAMLSITLFITIQIMDFFVCRYVAGMPEWYKIAVMASSIISIISSCIHSCASLIIKGEVE